MNFSESRILCIDDDTHTCDWIRIMLKGSKINAVITTVKTAREAFIKLNEKDFDLCIVEYALSDMTGVQFCSLVRRMNWHVPIMFLTAMNRPIDRETAWAAGANEYLCKPNDLDVFVDSVSRLLSRQVHVRNCPFQPAGAILPSMYS